ncbi:MAG: AAA family ATPase [Pseudomonadales bacterium]|jgi:predicted ATPase
MVQRIVITGGPGAGKTTLLRALERRGYAVVEEAARRIIADRKRIGLPPRPSPAAFAQEILQADLAHYETAGLRASGPVFFDRSLLDALGMLAALDRLPPELHERYLRRYPYHPKVFVLPPWQEIYTTDSERDQTYEESVSVHESIVRWYTRCGYEVVTVAPGPVEERCEFVLRQIGGVTRDG